MLSDDEKENEVGEKIAAAGAVEYMYTYLTVLKHPQLRIRGKSKWQSRVNVFIRGESEAIRVVKQRLALAIIEGNQMQSDAIGGNLIQSEPI